MVFKCAHEPAIYVGETQNLSRRTRNYCSPQPGQQTSYRLNGLLRGHLSSGGSVRLDIVDGATIALDDAFSEADFSRRPVRLLIENAALLQMAASGTHHVHNL